MIRKEQDGISWLQYELLSDFQKLKHAVFLKNGGSSSGSFSSLNMSAYVGDCDQSVEKNRERAAACLECTQWTVPRCVHGTEVKEVSERESYDSYTCDGLITKTPGLGLLITHADCQSAIFYDPIEHALAAVHSGWRGSVSNIYAHTVLMMQSRYGSKPENLLVGVSPSLCPDSAEFIHYKKELPQHFWKYQIKENYFDFWQISRMQLKECGLLPDHIEIAELSTYHNSSDYFSFRREGKTGRHGTLALICT